MKVLCSIVACLWLSVAANLVAHGDLHEQIEAVSLKIAQAPTAELFLKRGELHRAHQDFNAALADYEMAERLNPEMEAVLICRGRTLFEAGRSAPARAVLDRFLQKKPAHGEGYFTRGRVCAELKEYGSAVKDFNRAIELTPEAGPDHFVERAQAQIAMGDLDGAITGLEEGMRRLGPLFTLQSQAVDIELQRKRFDAALERLNGLIARAQRKESWLAQRAAIFEQAGRPEEAQRSYLDALTSIEALPAHLRTTRVTQELEARVRARTQVHEFSQKQASQLPTP